MLITTARAYVQDQPFAAGAYTCRGQTEHQFRTTIVALKVEDGTTGWGEAAPLGAFYAEAFPEQIETGVARLLPLLTGQRAYDPVLLAQVMNLAMLGQPAVKSAIDMAAWDLSARLAKRPLARLLGGGGQTAVPLYRSVSQADPDDMARAARDYAAQGYRRLQVKVGADPLEDVQRMRAVLAAIGPEITLYADANGGWRPGDAICFVSHTGDLDYWLEQPCMSLDETLTVARHARKPLVLNEAITSLADLLAAHGSGWLAGVTPKIARLGGVGPTRLLRDVAVQLGLKVTIEDTGGSTIDTAATAHLMCSMPPAAVALTVDFMNWVTVQNATGMPQTRDGQLILPEGPGLGIDVTADALGAPFATAGED